MTWPPIAIELGLVVGDDFKSIARLKIPPRPPSMPRSLQVGLLAILATPMAAVLSAAELSFEADVRPILRPAAGSVTAKNRN